MRLDKAIHTFEGILRGIALDSQLNEKELKELVRWKNEQMEYSRTHPFSEIIPKVQAALKDGIVTTEEQQDLLWLCNNLKTDSIYYNALTSDMQKLQGLLHGLMADGTLTDEEVRKLSEWTTENEHLRGCYPFDELDSVLTSALSDGKIDANEKQLLKDFIDDFTVVGEVPQDKIGKRHLAVSGVCAVCPEFDFRAKQFCLTGESRKAGRFEIARKLKSLGAVVKDNVTLDLNYLVVCAAGNSCWAFACYGRKVEQAVNYRKKGARIVIAHENDMWDAIADKSA
jgi:NAD-dependent DNA ligase